MDCLYTYLAKEFKVKWDSRFSKGKMVLCSLCQSLYVGTFTQVSVLFNVLVLCNEPAD